MTKQRRVVMEELAHCKHPSVEEVFARVRRRLPRVSLATVYRNLDHLVREGALLKVPALAGSRYDTTIRFHYHVVCVTCGKVEDIAVRSLHELEQHGSMAGYEIVGHRFELLGVCPNCQGKEPGIVKGR